MLVTNYSFRFLALTVLIGLTAQFASATNRTVMNLNDAGANSLRAVIAASVDNDTIDFSVTGTITLTSAELVIGRSITINGPGANLLTVARSSAGGTASFRIFHISNGTTTGPTVAIFGLTIKNGDATNGTFANEVGAGVYNDHGNLGLTNCVIAGNMAPDTGGAGIYNFGNTAGSATLNMTNCTISANSATGFAQGGGIFSVGNSGGSSSFNLTNCTFSQNEGYNGGAICLQGAGTSTMTNCTLSGNLMHNLGGGIIVSSPASLAINNCTISGNRYHLSGGGGQGAGIEANNGGGYTLRNTIVAGNGATTAPDVQGTFTSLGHNLIGKTDGSSGWVGSDLKGTVAAPLDPLLSPLEDNGGPTQTVALQATSSAIDAGDPTAPVGDQRFYVRAGAVDIGAYEFNGAIASVSSRKIHGPMGNFSVPLSFLSAVTTFSGSAGVSGSTDNSGAAASFNFPTSAAMDAITGNIYVADFGNHTIRKITPAGVVTTLAGFAGSSGTTDGTGSSARFNNPHGVAVDTSGNVYVADYTSDTIRKVTPGGVVSTFAGLGGSPGSTNGTGSAARFNNPAGLSLDSANNIYVADATNHVIRKITPGAVVTTLAGSPGNAGSLDGTGSAARFNIPFDTEVDSVGNVYVADFGNDTIRKIDTSAGVTTVAGVALATGSTDGAGVDARFNGPTGVTVDGSGRVYVADFNNDIIRRITNGVVRTIAGVAGSAGSSSGTGGVARFSGPGGVSLGSAGTIIVSDTNNQTIRLLQTNAPGVECRNGNPQIVFDFAYPVSMSSASLTLDPAVAGATGSVSNFSVIGSEVTVNTTNVSNAQTLFVTLSGVNDGTNIGSVSVPVSLLIGDTTGDGSVNSADIGQTKSKSGQSIDGTNFRNDVTTDGSINSADIGLVKSRSGTALP